MDDPAVFSDFVRNNLVVTTQWTIDVITNVLGYFGELLAVNDGDIDNFVKDTHSMNNSRTDAQKILIRNNVTHGFKSFFLAKYRIIKQ